MSLIRDYELIMSLFYFLICNLILPIFSAVGSFANPVVLKNDEISLGKHGEYKTKVC